VDENGRRSRSHRSADPHPGHQPRPRPCPPHPVAHPVDAQHLGLGLSRRAAPADGPGG
jgi:hypothetical protein